jgi:16S rRNA (guanine966-N2)-methyltransferase
MSLRIIGGKFKGRTLKTPPSLKTRPTQSMVREALFNICQNEIVGSSFLDCFAGSGAIGLEAISRGAKTATLIESDRQAIGTIKENISLLQVEDLVLLLPLKVEIGLKKLKNPFDIIYLDPPYDLPPAPFVQQIIESNLLKKGGLLFLEERSSSKQKDLTLSPLSLTSSRKFGEALLHLYIL